MHQKGAMQSGQNPFIILPSSILSPAFTFLFRSGIAKPWSPDGNWTATSICCPIIGLHHSISHPAVHSVRNNPISGSDQSALNSSPPVHPAASIHEMTIEGPPGSLPLRMCFIPIAQHVVQFPGWTTCDRHHIRSGRTGEYNLIPVTFRHLNLRDHQLISAHH